VWPGTKQKLFGCTSETRNTWSPCKRDPSRRKPRLVRSRCLFERGLWPLAARLRAPPCVRSFQTPAVGSPWECAQESGPGICRHPHLTPPSVRPPQPLRCVGPRRQARSSVSERRRRQAARNVPCPLSSPCDRAWAATRHAPAPAPQSVIAPTCSVPRSSRALSIPLPVGGAGMQGMPECLLARDTTYCCTCAREPACAGYRCFTPRRNTNMANARRTKSPKPKPKP
jgi:hypothetical protein